MDSILKYRFIPFALVMVFGVFSIGIPVIIASCSMPGMMGNGNCPMCNDRDDTGTTNITTEKNTTCCATTIAAERNTNEFMLAKSGVPDVTQLLFVILTDHEPAFILASPFCTVQPSPPAVVDIPILVSSLLI